MLKYDVKEVAPNTYILYEKGTTNKVNLHDEFLKLEAQGKFASKK